MKLINLLHQLMTRIVRKCQFSLGLNTLGPRAIVVNKLNQVLLMKHTYTGSWHLPEGGLKKGESVLQALSRELKEEVGLTLKEPP